MAFPVADPDLELRKGRGGGFECVNPKKFFFQNIYLSTQLKNLSSYVNSV